jgi:hypothetical protein
MFYDRVFFATATTGTGTITVGPAESGFRTMAGASIPDDQPVEYAITDGTAWETGIGTTGASATTMTRVLSASSTGALLDLSGSAKVFLTPIAAGMNKLKITGWSDYVNNWSTAPVSQGVIASGEVFAYTLNGTTRYRLVPSPYTPQNDAFYTTFTSGVLSGLIVTRG